MRILLWHVHGSWTTSFVQGAHEYVFPVDARRSPDGLGRARTWEWPPTAREVPVEALADEDVDVVLLQRPHELDLCERWLRRRPGRDVPALYVEHNTPGGGAVTTVHPLAERDDIPIVHVTHFNRLVWDNGRAPTAVVEHGIIDPGLRYGGEEARAAVVVNDPARRGRTVGTDLIVDLAEQAPVDVFGMGVDRLHAVGRSRAGSLRTFDDLPQQAMHGLLARRRVYVHTHRWTSLGLSLLEAMHLGMPVAALATTEAGVQLPADVGCVAVRPDELFSAVHGFLKDPERARQAGLAARDFALSRYGLGRFLADWDALLSERL
jgi:hypothetical protein